MKYGPPNRLTNYGRWSTSKRGIVLTQAACSHKK